MFCCVLGYGCIPFFSFFSILFFPSLLFSGDVGKVPNHLIFCGNQNRLCCVLPPHPSGTTLCPGPVCARRYIVEL